MYQENVEGYSLINEAAFAWFLLKVYSLCYNVNIVFDPIHYQCLLTHKILSAEVFIIILTILYLLSRFGAFLARSKEYQAMSSDKHSARFLNKLKMERVRTMLTHTYPYPHEHSRHAMIAVIMGCLFFISSDNMHTLVEKLDNNFKWWSMYACLLGFFYFFSSPFLGKTIQPSYSTFSRWWGLSLLQ